MSASLPLAAAPLLLSALVLIALLVPPMRPTACGTDPDDGAGERDDLADVELLLAAGIAP